MNYTRLLWGDILQCTKFEKQYAPVVVLGVILLFIPLLFYIFMKIYGTRKEKEIIRRKFFVSFFIYLDHFGLMSFI